MDKPEALNDVADFKPTIKNGDWRFFMLIRNGDWRHITMDEPEALIDVDNVKVMIRNGDLRDATASLGRALLAIGDVCEEIKVLLSDLTSKFEAVNEEIEDAV